MIDHYFTINKIGKGFYKEKGSKFLSFAYPVSNYKAVHQALEALKKEYYDARHYCYAYILGNEGETFRANDDGEPNHSAGDPILGQIRSKKLTNSLVVVVRYFGGTKLGVGGLVQAYKKAAEDALNNSNRITQQITSIIHISYTYDSTNHVMQLIDKYKLSILVHNFDENCSLKATVIISKLSQLKEDIQLLIDTGNEIIFKN